MVVYDITKMKTFLGAESWIKEAKENSPENSILILVGNKADLIEKEEVHPKYPAELAQKNNMKLMLVSAKDGIGIDDLFKNAVKDVIQKKKKIINDENKKRNENNDRNKSAKLSYNNSKNELNGCC